jgi:hypothetical protein
MELEFILADGSGSVKLTDYGRLLAGRRGDLAPLITLESRRIGNELLASMYRHEKRPLDLPFLFKAATEAELLTNVRTVLTVLTAGEGKLRVTRNDATVRELKRCYFRGGLGEKGWTQAAETVLSFDALDPFWYETSATENIFTISGSTILPFFPFFLTKPLRLLVSQVLNQDTVSNPGVEAWPIWTITGPGDTLSLENLTTGRKIVWNGTLTGSDQLEIDTRPLYKTVRLNGVNSWSLVQSSDADPWPMIAGNNDILVGLSNATIATQAKLSYTRRYVSL